MKFVGLLIRKLPLFLLAGVAFAAFTLGSHTLLDHLVQDNVGNCIHLDATTDICLVNVATAE